MNRILCRAQHVVQINIGQREKVRAMCFGDDKRVSEVNRAHVEDRDHPVVFPQDLRGKTSRNGVTQGAIHTWKPGSLLARYEAG